MQVLLSRPEMVYPGSQVQWVVPWTWVQRNGRVCAALASAGREGAAAAAVGEEPAVTFVTELTTEEEERAVGRGWECHPVCVIVQLSKNNRWNHVEWIQFS